MNRKEDFTCFNIRRFLQSDKAEPVGKENLTEILSDFICPKNRDVENFLRKNAVEFTRKNQSVTYLVFSNEDAQLLGYFTLAVKPITANADRFSNTARKKMLRVGEMDGERNAITMPAYLIAQLGKNYDDRAAGKITGQELLDIAMDTVRKVQYEVGGVVVFLEAVDHDKLKAFYDRDNGFKEFETRKSRTEEHEPQTLVQMLKVI